MSLWKHQQASGDARKDIVSEFATTLRNLAKKCDKSELDLVNLTGLDPSFVHRLMTGEKRPSPLTVVRLAIALPMCKELVAKDVSEVPHILSVLMAAFLSDAVAQSDQSRDGQTGA